MRKTAFLPNEKTDFAAQEPKRSRPPKSGIQGSRSKITQKYFDAGFDNEHTKNKKSIGSINQQALAEKKLEEY